jgi:TolA-binding protein
MGKDRILERILDGVKRTSKNQPATKSGERVITREQAREKIERLKNQEAAKVVQKKGSIAKKTTVSATDIKQAKTANDLDLMQRRIDEMNDGLIKKSMQNMLDAQRRNFEKMQADEVDRASRKSAQSARDRKMKGKVTLPELPFAKGGMAKKKAYSQGGMATGKPRTGHVDHRSKGMFK